MNTSQTETGVKGLLSRVRRLPLTGLNLWDDYIMYSSRETKGEKGLRSYIDKLCVVLKNGMEYLV